MFRIALCDDDVSACKRLKEQLLAFPDAAQLLVHTYFEGVDLKNAICAGERFDLIILDIQMKTMRGEELGALLREELQDRYTPILYISSYQEHAMALFDTQPLNFLIKPVEQEKLHKCLRAALSTFAAKKEFLDLIEEKIHRRIACCTIRYLESRNKQVVIHTTAQRYTCYEKLTDVLKRLPPEFLRLHKSFAVNHNFVTSYRADAVTLDNHKVLPISRNFRKQVQQALMDLRPQYGEVETS